MNLSIIHSRALAGISAPPVQVETHLANGLPAFNIVGLPETAVREARDRVRSALLAAVGEAQKRSLADPNAANLHAEGVGLVLLGSLDQAIDTLESASANAPENSAILSDLAAAYAARAASAQSARDWSNALDRSERALRMNPALTEAAFNRALALESLNLDGALVAWRTYLDLDRSSAWADEARPLWPALARPLVRLLAGAGCLRFWRDGRRAIETLAIAVKALGCWRFLGAAWVVSSAEILWRAAGCAAHSRSCRGRRVGKALRLPD